ncbi:MAG: TVP38/TMEM64 family protein [bacterium]|nr:TVP38/TMEM64 family protein [bacterium]
MKNLLRLFLFIFFILAWFVFIKFDLISYLNITSIKEKQAVIVSFTKNNMILSMIIYSAVYIVTTALSLPGAAVLTLTGGMLFGIFCGTSIVILSASTGAVLAFLSTRFIFGEWACKKYNKQLYTFNKGLAGNVFNYILFLRLVPLFPFFLINIVMGITTVKTRDFFTASAAGMLPGTFVYCNAGSQLASIKGVDDLLSPGVLLSFFLLGGLALIPVIYKKLKSKAG